MSALSQLLVNAEALQWRRPSEWIELQPGPQDQRRSLIALVAVNPKPTSLGLRLTGCPFTVDWGDGLVQQYTSGEHATHTYQFSRLPAATFTSRGYRQAVVKLSWESGGGPSKLEVTDYTAVNDVATNTTPLLEIHLAGRALTNVVLSPPTKPSRMCEQVWIRPALDHNSWNTFSAGLFEEMNALQSVPEFDLGLTTNMDRMFRNCTSLRVAPVFDETYVTSMREIFAGCTALVSAGMKAPACTDFTRAFAGCTSLVGVVFEECHAVLSWQDAFRDCTSLVDVDIACYCSATDLSGMFSGCTALQELPAMEAPHCVTTDNMFSGCVSLTTLGDFVMPENLNMGHMFAGCWQMRELPNLGFGQVQYVFGAFSDMYALQATPRGFDTSECVEFTALFANCMNLVRAPELSTANVRSFNGVFLNCTMLESIPPWDFGGVTNSSGLAQAFDNLRSCTRVLGRNFQASFKVSSLPLGVQQLNELFGNLGQLQGISRVVDIQGIAAALSDGVQFELATAKGWQVSA